MLIIDTILYLPKNLKKKLNFINLFKNIFLIHLYTNTKNTKKKKDNSDYISLDTSTVYIEPFNVLV